MARKKRKFNPDGTLTKDGMTFPLSLFVDEENLQLDDLKPIKKGEDIIGWRYHLYEADTHVTLIVKVPGAKPVISVEDFNASSDEIYVFLPLQDTELSLYQISYGKGLCTISAPFVKLSEN